MNSNMTLIPPFSPPHHHQVSRNNDWPIELCDDVANALGTYLASTTREASCSWVSPRLAGGCPKHATWCDNPKYVLAPSRGGAFRLTVSQTDGAPRAVGLLVLQGVSGEPPRGGGYSWRPWPGGEPPNSAVGPSRTPEYRTGQPMTIEVDLQHLEPPSCYVLVPHTYDPGEDGAFRLEVSSQEDHGFTLEPRAV